jgi:orotate phosphoribosyltransferase
MLSAVMSSVLDLFEETGAYLHGHFRLTSGSHSGEYLQCAKVLAHPAYAEKLGRALAEKVRVLSAASAIDAVVAPAMGGIIIGHEVARALGAVSLFTERDAASNEMTLRRGFEIEPGQKVVVIEDVITTGGSTKEVVKLLQALGAKVVAAGSIIDRSGGNADVGVARESLETMHPVVYSPEECPLCKQGLPVVKPGSRRT